MDERPPFLSEVPSPLSCKKSRSVTPSYEKRSTPSNRGFFPPLFFSPRWILTPLSRHRKGNFFFFSYLASTAGPISILLSPLAPCVIPSPDFHPCSPRPGQKRPSSTPWMTILFRARPHLPFEYAPVVVRQGQDRLFLLFRSVLLRPFFSCQGWGCFLSKVLISTLLDLSFPISPPARSDFLFPRRNASFSPPPFLKTRPSFFPLSHRTAHFPASSAISPTILETHFVFPSLSENRAPLRRPHSYNDFLAPAQLK